MRQIAAYTITSCIWIMLPAGVQHQSIRQRDCGEHSCLRNVLHHVACKSVVALHAACCTAGVVLVIADRRGRRHALQARCCYLLYAGLMVFDTFICTSRQIIRACDGVQEGARREPRRNCCARFPCRDRAGAPNGTLLVDLNAQDGSTSQCHW